MNPPAISRIEQNSTLIHTEKIARKDQLAAAVARRSMPPTIIIPGTASSAAKYFKATTSRREALSLYREILRTSKAFHWCDEEGIPWNQRLRAEARKEFEASKEENDPLIIARMLVTGRDCVQQIQHKFSEADRKAWERIEKDSSRRG